MSEAHKPEPVIDPFSLAPPSKLPELTDKLLVKFKDGTEIKIPGYEVTKEQIENFGVE